ncbi:hypothetical protein Agabi119p4_8563 [Agaricus bisporus var. burnettii]|uniref:Uncharacterized protein n=1 Tax=Agaricus bisporus var. burnettii TaxID=192524 RepID=A0A8H7EYV4_AGABI|nr:hypothetical protein Agabi119p4_8563 [Agaricus bisporus var. burnettii]
MAMVDDHCSEYLGNGKALNATTFLSVNARLTKQLRTSKTGNNVLHIHWCLGRIGMLLIVVMPIGLIPDESEHWNAQV